MKFDTCKHMTTKESCHYFQLGFLTESAMQEFSNVDLEDVLYDNDQNVEIIEEYRKSQEILEEQVSFASDLLEKISFIVKTRSRAIDMKKEIKQAIDESYFEI